MDENVSTLSEVVSEGEPFLNDYFKKSNFLISAKYKSTLLENKILMLGLVSVKKNEKGKLVSEMKASFLREMIQEGKKNGSFYDQLLATSLKMTDRKFIIQDEDGFDIFHLTPRAKYEKKVGVFKIFWEDELEKYLYMVQKNYTPFSIKMFMQFDSVFTFRLYEILKSKMYIPKFAEDSVAVEGYYKIVMSLAELKLDMGAVDASEAKVQGVLFPAVGKKSKDPDFEKAVSVANSKTYEKWQTFKDHCLEKAVKEINKKTDIEVTYEPLKSGRGAKVISVAFYVKKKMAMVESKPKTGTIDEQFDIMEKIQDIIEEKVSLKDINALATEASYDVGLVRRAYDYVKRIPSEKESLVGYMIWAIRHNFPEPVKSKGRKKNEFTDIPQRGDNMSSAERSRYMKLEEKLMLGYGLTDMEQAEHKELSKKFNM